ncbi:MAG: hypothetical protein GY845_09690 [Planctomycetes bacterium]|nr:hypothetical protein [Planctomycetota bacterium]
MKTVLIVVGVLILLVVGGVAIFWKQLPFRLILPYIKQEPIVIQGKVQKVNFTGAEAGQQTFFIYLPEGYESSDQTYSTIYHLHGAFLREPWAGYECEMLGSKVEEAVSAGIIDPMIVVCLVDPDGDSMWSDGYDGQHQISTGFTKDLIPYIDKNYRTVPERGGRVLQGFSMGGFGAVTNGFRNPELFSAILIWDGALHNWETITTSRKKIADKMFASEEYFDQWSPWQLTQDGVDVDIDLFMVVGEMEQTSEFGSRFVPLLQSTGREFAYYDVACPHSMFCIMDELGAEGFKFIAESLAK